MRGTNTIFEKRWVRTTAYSLLGILMFLGLWQGLSSVFAQMPPPATTICAIMPDFCPSSTPIVDPPPGGGGSPSYTINKEIVNADGTPNSQRIYRPGDEIKYKITIAKVEPVLCLASPGLVGAPVNFDAIGGNGSYDWSIDTATFISGTSGQQVTVSFANPGTYIASIKSGDQTGACSVVINPQPPADDPSSLQVLYDLDVLTDSDGKEYIYVAGSNGMVAKSSDGGNTWENKSISSTDNLYILSIDAVNKDIVWLGARNYPVQDTSFIYRSTDGGATWVLLKKKNSGSQSMAGSVQVSATSADNAWLGSGDITNDGGKTWIHKSDDSGKISAVDASKAVYSSITPLPPYTAKTQVHSFLKLTQNGWTTITNVLNYYVGSFEDGAGFMSLLPHMYSDSSGIAASSAAKNHKVVNKKIRFFTTDDGSLWNEKMPFETPKGSTLWAYGLDKYHSGSDSTSWVAGIRWDKCAVTGWLLAKTTDQGGSWSLKNSTDCNPTEWKTVYGVDANSLNDAWVVGNEYYEGGKNSRGLVGKVTIENGIGTNREYTGVPGIYIYK